MRIATSWAHQTAVNSMLDQQSRLNRTQMQLSTGKKILTPSDDPAAAARIIDLNQGIKQTEQYQSNINVARQRLSLEDGVLQDATGILQRINELGIQGLNATYSPSDRVAIAVEMEELNQQLLGLANTKNANGEYLFSGFKSATQPFSKNTVVDGSAMAAVAQTGTININGVPTASITTTAAGAGSRALVVSAINAISIPTGVIAIDSNSDSDGVRLEAADGRNIAVQFTGTLDSASTGVSAAAVAAAVPLIYVAAYNYAGDTNQRLIQIDSDRQIADGDPGSTNVFGISTGSLLSTTVLTPGSITNIFEAIDKFATDLKANAPNSASLDDISNSLGKILAAQSSVGTRLNVLDNQEGHNADFVLNMKTVLSATEDLDYAEAISRFNQQTLSLQAAQQAFAQVKKLSLFNYL